MVHANFKAAVIQVAPVYMDLKGTLAKSIKLIDEAAANGAKLIAFPETWLPGYPWWLWLGAPAWGLQFVPRYHANCMRVDGPEMADAELAVIVHDPDKGFISGAEMFWLASVDHKSSPTVSYKGGAPCFVHILNDKTLLFPNYDGNGMYFSMGNIATTSEIGMLFMAFDRPARLRVQGKATLTDDKAMVPDFRVHSLQSKWISPR